MSLPYVILSSLNQLKEATGYEIAKEFEQVSAYFWRASFQQVYRDLGRLEEKGWVRSRQVEQQGKPDKKIYSLTQTGFNELLLWIKQPVKQQKSNNELLIKLTNAFLLTKDEALQMVKNELGNYQRQLEIYQSIKNMHFNDMSKLSLPEQLVYLALKHGIARESARIDWAKECLKDLTVLNWNECQTDSV